MSLKITEDNYNTYRAVFKILSEHIWKKLQYENSDDAHPVKVLERLEKKSKSLARRGLKEGLRNIAFWLKDFPQDVFSSINQELEENKLPTVYSLQESVSGTLSKVLKSARIKLLDEYYTIKEFVIDQTNSLSKLDRTNLDRYLGEFEFRNKYST
jgi:hypothetical protein